MPGHRHQPNLDLMRSAVEAMNDARCHDDPFRKMFETPVSTIDYDRLATAIVDEMERREITRGERYIVTKKRVAK